MHDAPVVRFLPKLGRETSHGLFFVSIPPPGCDVSFLAKLENSVVAWLLSLVGETWRHAVDRRQTDIIRQALIDPYGRTVDYLRVSVTDRCDLRCVYCMAEEMTFLPKAESADA